MLTDLTTSGLLFNLVLKLVAGVTDGKQSALDTAIVLIHLSPRDMILPWPKSDIVDS